MYLALVTPTPGQAAIVKTMPHKAYLVSQHFDSECPNN